MKEVHRLNAERQVKDSLAMRNGPNTKQLLRLPLQSKVQVWLEKDGWNGPYTLLAMDGQTCTIQMPYEPTNFRSTVVKLYCTDEPIPSTPAPDTLNAIEQEDGDTILVDTGDLPVPKRRRGRPRGSKNKLRTEQETFLTAKEQGDLDLSIQLRLDGTITGPGPPFQAADKKEIDDLLTRGVFAFEQYDELKHGRERIFKSRIVRQIKDKETPTPFEKSRLVIQVYNDFGKEVILTQSPTIQRASQRLIIALTPTLLKLGMALWVRDSTQAYVRQPRSFKDKSCHTCRRKSRSITLPAQSWSF